MATRLLTAVCLPNYGVFLRKMFKTGKFAKAIALLYCIYFPPCVIICCIPKGACPDPLFIVFLGGSGGHHHGIWLGYTRPATGD